MSLRETIVAVFEQVASDQGRKLVPLTDEVKLTDCGLDSLSFAIVVSSLEDTLGVDPFNASEWVEFPVTFADFIKSYAQTVT
jgi:acyl carrier protein